MKYFYEDQTGVFSAAIGTKLDFGPHIHGHVELVGMLEGNTSAYIESRKYELNAGDIFIVFPNQIHYYESHMDERYMIFLFPPEVIDQFSYLFNQKTPVDSLICGGLEDPELKSIMLTVVRMQSEEKAPCDMLQMKGYVFVLLGKILSKLELGTADPKEMQTINMILNYCISHSSERLLLEDVADALHINKYYISHLFSEKLGMGFGNYVRSLRITQACRLLEQQDMSITDVAYAVGFSSTRTFNRIFIKYLGMTPRDYRKNHLSSSSFGMKAPSPDRDGFRQDGLPVGTATYLLADKNALDKNHIDNGAADNA